MKRWKIILGLSMIFLAGVLVGTVGTGLYVKNTLGYAISGKRPFFKKFVMKKLTGELHLTSSQQEKIGKIVDGMQSELLELRRKNQPEVQEIIARGVALMKQELQPEQQDKLDAMYEKARNRWLRRRGEHSFNRRHSHLEKSDHPYQG